MKKGLSIRPAEESDLQALLDIQKAAFMRYTEFLAAEQIPPLRENLTELMEDIKRKSMLAAEYNHILSGSIRYSIKGGVCIIERLSVRPDHQGRGIGRALVNEVEALATGKAHKLYLETGLLANNLLLFYTKLGYSGEAVLRRHYGGFDWIVFSKFV